MNKPTFDLSRLPDFNKCIPHYHWCKTLEEFFAALVCAQPGELVALVGPSRGGKTTMLNSTLDLLFDKDTIPPGEMPVVNTIALNDGHNGSFDTKEFTLNLLDAIEHPIYSQKANQGLTDLSSQKYQRTPESLFKRALINGFHSRKTRYLAIDETQHIRFATKNAKAPEAILDQHKCMAQEVGYVLILIGTYPMLEILQRSPHLLGRKDQIHLPRYQWNDRDIPHFAQIIKTYSDLLTESDIQNSLMESVPLIYHATFGCVGLLGKLIRSSATRAIIRGCPVDGDLIQEVRLSDSDLEKLRKECLEGERLLVKQTFDPPSIQTKGKPPKSTKASDDSKPKPKTKSRPFQRKPENMQKGHRATKERGRVDNV